MHEQEAIIFIKNAMEQSRNALAELMLSAPKVFKRRTELLGEYYSNLENCKKEIQSCEIAINALEEIQQYRAIGKPKEIKQKLEELERWHTYRLAINVKNPFAKMSTSICHNCDHKDDYIEELEAEVEEYRKIGTLEECRAAVEKQKAKKPIEPDEEYGTFKCPSCGGLIFTEDRFETHKYCLLCGQRLDWSDEE